MMPDKMSQEKINLLRGLGAKVVVTPTAVHDDPPRLLRPDRLAAETPNAFYIDQFNNPDNPEAHYRNTGPELCRQLDGPSSPRSCSRWARAARSRARAAT